MVERRTVEIGLRPATIADAAAIAAVWETGWHDGHRGNVPDVLVAARTSESFHTRAQDRIPETTIAVVGEDGAEIAGFIVVHGEEVEQVYVATGHRGTGIAAILLAEAERQVATAGHPSAWLAVAPGNTRARRFYERHGWTDGGLFTYEAEHDGGTIDVPCHRYVKTVTAT